MALLDVKTREKYLKELGYKSVKEFQKAVMYPQWVDGVYGSQTDNALRTAYNVHKYCKNFSPKEFMCECGGKYCGGYPDYMKPSELKHIQTIRDHYGKPITITSGLRCKEWNRVLNGSVENSGHLRGLALDFWLPGVTDTVANRKAAMRYFMSLPNHKFTYGKDMAGSDGIYRSASYMGNAMHTECYNTNAQPGKLNVDGIGGGQTVMAIQKHFGLKVIDGIISGQSKDLGKYYTSLIAVEYGVGGSATVKALQKWAGCTADGVWGQGTSKALQNKLNSLGYSVGSYGADGYFGTDSMKALQRFLRGDKPGPVPPTPTDYYKMIDVSEFQPSIDWAKVKADGVKGVIIRCGGRGGGSGKIYEDSMFMEYIKGAHAAGIPVGIYFLTQAITAAEGKAEAQYAIKQWTKAGVPISYPICIDSENVTWKNEDGSTGYGRANDRNLLPAKRTIAIKGFVDEIKRQGYKAMIYASTGWLNNQVDMSKLDCDVWVAQYYSECQYKGKYIIWQYTSEGSVNGVKGVVDMNRCYIKAKAVNPPKPEPTPGKKSYPGNYPDINRAKKLMDEAIRLAWPSGTPKSKYAWNGGGPTAAFAKALDTVYPEHGSWGPAPSKGCSCDVFVGTVVRSSGIDPKFPRGLDEQETYTPQGMFKYVLGNADMYKQSKDGDIIWYDYSGPGGHVLIRGKDCIYQAGYQSTYGHTTDGHGEIKDTEPKVIIFRPRNYLEKGDAGIEVKRLQHYLIWGGWLAKGQDDSMFGVKTETATKKMQNALGVVADGKAGADTLKAMRAYRK